MPNMEPMKTFTVGADTWEIVDGAARDELTDARTGADGVEYESAGEAMRESVNGINDDLEANYALQDGYYEMLTAGSADNLTGRGDGVGAEFIYRTAGGSADVADGVAKINSIHGNTVVWNQLVTSEDHTATSNGQTFVFDNGKVTITGTKAASGWDSVCATEITSHKYLVAARNLVVGSDSTDGIIHVLGNYSDSSSRSLTVERPAIILDNTSGTYQYYRFAFGASSAGTVVDKSCYPQIFDLTRMFGAGNEPATVEEFEALFPASYYAYDAGSLLNVNMEGVRTVGFNQWDEEWESGLINASGGKSPSEAYIRSKNFINVFPNTEYTFTRPTGYTVYIAEYDIDKNFIVRTAFGTDNAYKTFTTAANTAYTMFCIGGTNTPMTTYNNDICINLSWSGYRNGEYEEYWTQERAIDAATYFPDGMKSAGSAYDELTATKAIKRVGVVDLGTLSWNYVAENDYMHATATALAAKPSTYNIKTPAPHTNAFFVSDGSRLRLYGTGYTDGATFKAAMSGVMLYYELAEPVETEISPELNLTYKVSDFGTEEIITANDAQTAPVPMQIVYGLNAVDTIRRLPVEYISHKSFMQFMSAIESHFNVTITETYDSDNERYNYSIATNESGE